MTVPSFAAVKKAIDHDVQVGVYTISGKSVTKKGFAVFRVFQELSHTPHNFFLKIDTSNITPEKKSSKNLSSALRSIHSNLKMFWTSGQNSDFIRANGEILCIHNTKDFSIRPYEPSLNPISQNSIASHFMIPTSNHLTSTSKK